MESKNISQFYLEVRCQKGNNCRRSHDIEKRPIKQKVKNMINTRHVKMETHINSCIVRQNAKCTKNFIYVMILNADLVMCRMISMKRISYFR